MKEAPGQTTLATMAKGRTGRILEVRGGECLRQRLEVLGIRPGRSLTKVSNAFLKGPVLVQLGTARVAVGFGMAAKVLVEVDGAG